MPGALIRTTNLGRTYRKGGHTVEALSGVTLRIDRGEFVAIMGPSGSGKSSLMNLLGFLDSPTAGEYRYAGEDVSRLGHDRLAALRRADVGFVFQNFNLLGRCSAVENVELPLIYAGVDRAGRRSRALTALSAVGLGHRRDHWPHQMSGGEQQRVAIARALVNSPSVIFADEPTGALDSRTGLGVLALFQVLNRNGMTVVMVTHDPVVARHAGRIVTLADGRLRSDETVAEPSDATGWLEAFDAAPGGAASPAPA